MRSVADKTYLSAIHQSNNKVFLEVGPWVWGEMTIVTDAVSDEVDSPVNRELDDYVTFPFKQQFAQRWI
jgi:hypothetical protein